ncbi:MAG TPA: ParB/RepB/Spo0J family partition protein [Bacteroidaceae bacterium]|nr:ParB/RepB/Spo0J family partition protein [Bacteroidaceae bacterium]
MAKKNALGRGLGALIDMSDESDRQLIRSAAAVNEIPLDNILGNPYQPRSSFDENALDELVQSVREHGIIQPITVRRTEDNQFQLITGERRLRAARKAGLRRIPAYVRGANDENMLELALVENIQREDLDAIEVALSYHRLIEECNLTQENLADRVGKKRATVANYLRLLRLSPEIQAGIKEKKLDMGHARALLGVEDPEIQLEIYEKILKQDLSVRAVENLVRKSRKGEQTHQPKQDTSSAEYDQLRKHLSQHFGVPVDFKRNNKGAGRIVIPFASDDDLQRIVSILDKPGE